MWLVQMQMQMGLQRCLLSLLHWFPHMINCHSTPIPITPVAELGHVHYIDLMWSSTLTTDNVNAANLFASGSIVSSYGSFFVYARDHWKYNRQFVCPLWHCLLNVYTHDKVATQSMEKVSTVANYVGDSPTMAGADAQHEPGWQHQRPPADKCQGSQPQQRMERSD